MVDWIKFCVMGWQSREHQNRKKNKVASVDCLTKYLKVVKCGLEYHTACKNLKSHSKDTHLHYVSFGLRGSEDKHHTF